MNHISKYIPIAFVSLLILSPMQNAMAKPTDTEIRIQKIDAAVRHAKKIEKELNTGTDRGGSLTGYVVKSQMVKIVLDVGLSHEDVVYEYYLQNKVLVSVVETKRIYGMIDKTGELDFQHPEKIMKATFRFYHGKLNGSDGPTEMIPPTSADMKAKETELLSGLRIFTKALKSKSKSVDIEKWVKG